MRSLRITAYARDSIILPLAYNELLHGLLYSCWRDNAPQIHDEGYKDGAATYRLFTFGPLRATGTIDTKKRTIRMMGPITFEVRTPLEELLDILASELAARGVMRIGAHELPLVNLDACDRLLFPKRALIKAIQPIVATRKSNNPDAAEKRESGSHSEYLSPSDDGWHELIHKNALGKARAYGLDCGTDLQIIPLSTDSMRKRVTRFKGTYITGWMGEFALSCDPQLMQLLYSCGLGSKNSQGFGMFGIDDRPL